MSTLTDIIQKNLKENNTVILSPIDGVTVVRSLDKYNPKKMDSINDYLMTERRVHKTPHIKGFRQPTPDHPAEITFSSLSKEDKEFFALFDWIESELRFGNLDLVGTEDAGLQDAVSIYEFQGHTVRAVGLCITRIDGQGIPGWVRRVLQ